MATGKTTGKTAGAAARKASSGAGKERSAKAKPMGANPILKRARGVGVAAIVESLVIAVLGALLIAYPNMVLQVVFYVVGIFLMVKGVYKILNYFAMHDKYSFYNNDLLYGVIALVFGVLLVVLWEKLSSAIGIVAGAWMIYGALVRMSTAIKMHAAGVKMWFYALLMSFLLLALGIYVIMSLSVAVMIVGWAMIAAAVISIVDDLIFIRNVGTVEKALE